LDHVALLARAEAATRLAGTRLRERGAGLLAVDLEAGRDVKLAADRVSETVLVESLVATGLPIYSEESGAIEWHGGGDYWLIDPLDGTANYAAGVPLCCVSVGLMSEGRPIAGVVYDFNRDEMFVGARGHGSSLNGNPICVSAKSAMNSAVLSTGLPVRGDFSDHGLQEFGRHMARWKKVRLIGSAALSLAYVAAGRFDAYRERSIMPWDVAAGWALVEAAGGVVQGDIVELSTPIDVFASNPALAAALADG
jgi:myo-inositol-1(or 4)-monophosphatase